MWPSFNKDTSLVPRVAGSEGFHCISEKQFCILYSKAIPILLVVSRALPTQQFPPSWVENEKFEKFHLEMGVFYLE